MGIEYSVELVVGWVVTDDVIPEKFILTIPDVFHIEDRFSQKTGEKIGQERVVDVEGHDVYVLGGVEYEDVGEFFDSLAALVGAVASCLGSGSVYSFEPLIVAHRLSAISTSICEVDEQEGFRVGESGQFGLEDVVGVDLCYMEQCFLAAVEVRRKLVELGFGLPEPRVMAVLLWS